MSVDVIVIVFTLLLMGGLFHIIPALTRPDLFFAVTVDPEFRRTPDGRRIELRFRIVVWSATLIAVVLTIAASARLEAVLIEAAAFAYALASAHRRTLRHALPPNPIVEVDLAAPRESLPGGLITMALPVLFLAALGGWAAFHWDRLPSRIPVHWGIHGADHWVTTTPASVAGLIALLACTSLLLIATAWGILNWARRVSTSGPRAAAERHFRRRVVLFLVITAYLVICPAWFALFSTSAALVNAWCCVLLAVMAGFVVSLMRGGQGGARTAASVSAAPAGDRTPDECWKWGLLYVNPADPSILVEKRFGIGYTVNFGNRRTWVALALLLALLAAALVVLR